MPCYQVNLISMDLKVSNPDLMLKALKSIGYQNVEHNKRENIIYFEKGNINLEKGVLTARTTFMGNVIKKAYSTQVIEDIAKKKKWLLKKQENGKIIAKKTLKQKRGKTVMADQIEFEILDDGTISIKTDSISGVNHLSADQFLEEIETLLGTKRKTTKLKPKHMHTIRTQKTGHKH